MPYASPHIAALLNMVDRYQIVASGIEGKEIKDTTVGVRILGHANKIAMLRAGADMTSARVCRAAIKLGEIWPNDDVPTEDINAITMAVHEKDQIDNEAA